MATGLVVSITLLIVEIYSLTNYDALSEIKTKKMITECLASITKATKTSRTTWNIISEVEELHYFANINNNTYIILNVNSTISKPMIYNNNYIILMKNNSGLLKIVGKLLNSSLWDRSLGPRGRFIVVSFTKEPNMEVLFRFLWKKDIIDTIFISPSEVKEAFDAYNSYPYDVENDCGRKVNIRNLGDCTSTKIKFSGPPRKTNNCPILVGALNVLYGLPFIGDFNYKPGLFIYPIKLIAEVLNLNIIYRNLSTPLQIKFMASSSDELRKALYEGGDDIIIANGNRYLVHVAQSDQTDIFFYDDAIWIAPKPIRLSNVKVLTSIFRLEVWISIITAVFLVAIIFCRITVHERERNLKNLVKFLMYTCQITLNVSVNILPSSNAMRIMLGAYLLYSINVTSYFQGTLGSILTNPGFERGIRSVEELSDSNTITPMTYNNHKKRLYSFNDSTAQNLASKAIVITTGSIEDTYKYLSENKNVTLTSYMSILKYYENYISKIHIFDKKYLLNLEATYSTRKGHPLLVSINRVICQIQEAGFQKKWLSDLSKRTFEEYVEEDVVLSLDHLQAAFFLLCLGYSLASIIFLLELFWNKIHKIAKRIKQKRRHLC